MLQDVFESVAAFPYHNLIVVESVSWQLINRLRRDKIKVSLSQSQQHIQFERVIEGVLQLLYISKQIKQSAIRIISCMSQHINSVRINDSSIEVGLSKFVKVEDMEKYRQFDQEFNKSLLILKMLSGIEFEETAKQENSDKNLPIKVSSYGLQLIKQACQQLKLSDKAILKLILFEKIDTVQRVIIPYSLAGCKNNVQTTLDQLRERLRIVLKIRNQGCDWWLDVVKMNTLTQPQQQATALLNFLLGDATNSNISKSNMKMFHICRTNRSSAVVQNILKQVKREKSDGMRLEWFCRQYIKFKSVQSISRNGMLKLYFKQIKLKGDVSRCCQWMVEEVVTAAESRSRNTFNVSIMEKYFKGYVQYRCLMQSKKRQLLQKRIQSYIKCLPVFIDFNAKLRKKKFQITHVQCYIRSYLLRKRQLIQMTEALLQDQYNSIKKDEQIIPVMTSVLNLNNEAKSFEAIVFVQMRVISFRNIACSNVFDCIYDTMPLLLREMEKKHERVKYLDAMDTSLVVTTDKRKIRMGVTVSQNKQQHPNLSQYEWTNDNSNHTHLPIVSQGMKFKVLTTKSKQLYAVGVNTRGQMGTGPMPTTQNIPLRISLPAKVRRVSCGLGHSVCLTQQNQVYLWGYLQSQKPIVSPKPKLCEWLTGLVLDVQSSNTSSFALLENRTIWDVVNNKLYFKQDNPQFMPYQIFCIKSLTLQTVILKELVFSHTRLSLKDRKEITKLVALKPADKRQLFKVSYDEQYQKHFNERNMLQPIAITNENANEANLLHRSSHESTSSGLDLTFSI